MDGRLVDQRTWHLHYRGQWVSVRGGMVEVPASSDTQLAKDNQKRDKFIHNQTNLLVGWNAYQLGQRYIETHKMIHRLELDPQSQLLLSNISRMVNVANPIVTK